MAVRSRGGTALSTVVRVMRGRPQILREGAISASAIANVLGGGAAGRLIGWIPDLVGLSLMHARNPARIAAPFLFLPLFLACRAPAVTGAKQTKPASSTAVSGRQGHRRGCLERIGGWAKSVRARPPRLDRNANRRCHGSFDLL